MAVLYSFDTAQCQRVADPQIKFDLQNTCCQMIYDGPGQIMLADQIQYRIRQMENQALCQGIPYFTAEPQQPKKTQPASDLYSLAFPEDPIQEYFEGVYAEIESRYTFDEEPSRLFEIQERKEQIAKPKQGLQKDSFRKWIKAEICITALDLLAGIVLYAFTRDAGYTMCACAAVIWTWTIITGKRTAGKVFEEDSL